MAGRKRRRRGQGQDRQKPRPELRGRTFGDAAQVPIATMSSTHMGIIEEKPLNLRVANARYTARYATRIAQQESRRVFSALVFICVYGFFYFHVMRKTGVMPCNTARGKAADIQTRSVVLRLLSRCMHDSDKGTSWPLFCMNIGARLFATYSPSIFAAWCGSSIVNKYIIHNEAKVWRPRQLEKPSERDIFTLQRLSGESIRKADNARLYKVLLLFTVNLFIFIPAIWIVEELVSALLPTIFITPWFLWVSFVNDWRLGRGGFDQSEALTFEKQTEEMLKMEERVYSGTSFRSYKVSFHFLNEKPQSKATHEMLYQSFADVLYNELGVHIIKVNDKGIEFSWDASHSKRDITRISRLMNKEIQRHKGECYYAYKMFSQLEEAIVSLQPKFQFRNEQQGYCLVVNVGKKMYPTQVKEGLVKALTDLLDARCVLEGVILTIKNLETLCEAKKVPEIKKIFEKAFKDKNEYYKEAAAEDSRRLGRADHQQPAYF